MTAISVGAMTMTATNKRDSADADPMWPEEDASSRRADFLHRISIIMFSKRKMHKDLR